MADEKNLVRRIRFIKKNLPIDEAISEISGVVFTGSEDTLCPDGNDVCPCGEHRNNFRISLEKQRAFCHTPGCNARGDLIDFVEGYLGIDRAAAVKHIETLFEGELTAARQEGATRVSRPDGSHDCSPMAYPKPGIQDPTKADYQFMLDVQSLFVKGLNESEATLNYLQTSRGHSTEVLRDEGVGYVSRGLRVLLGAIGDKTKLDRLERHGLLTRKRKDIATPGLITFPIRDLDGRVCGFRFKDPQKRQMAQQFKHGLLGDVPFLGMHTLKDLAASGRIMLVEGEHDWLSVRRAGWDEGLLATCGRLSFRQIDWLRWNIGRRKLVTLFDNDHGGEKYREEVAEKLPDMSVMQYVPAGYKADPNSILRSGGTLAGMLTEEHRWQK